MKEQTNYDYEKYVQIAQMAKMGWWESDLKNKEYILSTTWNAPEEVFNNPAAFFDGKNVDDVLISFHKTMEFCGLKKRKTLSFHNVVKNPQFKFYKQTIEDYFLKEL